MKRSAVTLSHLEELQASTPIPQPTQKAYNGCLTAEQRQIMADIYKGAKLHPVHVTKRTMSKYRKEFE